MISEKEYKLLRSAQGSIQDYLYKSEQNELTTAAFNVGRAFAKIEELIRDYEANGGKTDDD